MFQNDNRGDRINRSGLCGIGLLVSLFLLTGCSIPMKLIDTTANALVKTVTTTIQTTGSVLKSGAGLASTAAKKAGSVAPLAAALAAHPVEPAFVP